MKQKKEESRRKLLESAAKEFALNGYTKTNIDNVAINAGFGKGTIYNYFKSKLELFLAVVRESVNELVIEMENEIKSLDNPVEKFKKIIEVDVRNFDKNTDLFITILKESYTVDRTRLNSFYEASYPLFEMFLKTIIEGMEKGYFSSKINPSAVAAITLGMNEDLSILNKMQDNKLGTPDQLADLIFDLLINGIKGE